MLRPVRVAIDQDDRGARSRQEHRRRLPRAEAVPLRSGPGDHRDLALELACLGHGSPHPPGACPKLRTIVRCKTTLPPGEAFGTGDEGRAMSTSTVETIIGRPADAVWAVIGDFGDPSWRGGIESCTLEGKVRTVTTAGMDLEIEETEFEHDTANRTYSYGVTAMRGRTSFDVGGDHVLDLSTMVGHHRATLSVVPIDDTSATVRYTLELDDGHDQTFESTLGQYRSVVERLRDRLAASAER